MMMEMTIQDKLLKNKGVSADHGVTPPASNTLEDFDKDRHQISQALMRQKKYLRQQAKSGKPKNKSTHCKPVDYNDNILGQKVKRTKSATKPGDKTSKKTKPHNSAVNNLLQTGWMVMNKNRHQITLVKIPDNNSTNSESGIKCGESKVVKQTECYTEFYPLDKETTDLKQGDGNVDVDVNVADKATRKISVLSKFIRGSRKILRRLRCGKAEE